MSGSASVAGRWERTQFRADLSGGYVLAYAETCYVASCDMITSSAEEARSGLLLLRFYLQGN